MQLEVEEASEEVEGGLLLVGAALFYGYVQETQSLRNFLSFLALVHEAIAHGEAVAAHNADDVEAVRVLVVWEAKGRLPKKLTRHQVVFGVHFEDASAQPLVVSGRPVDGLRTQFLGFGHVLEGVLVLFNGHISIGSIDVDVEN